MAIGKAEAKAKTAAVAPAVIATSINSRTTSSSRK